MKSKLIEAFHEDTFLFADGFDDAIIGVDESSMRVIYSMAKCIDILVKEGMSELEAEEHFYHNVYGAYVGEKTPIWCTDFDL